jgi:hypothetical protein
MLRRFSAASKLRIERCIICPLFARWVADIQPGVAGIFRQATAAGHHYYKGAAFARRSLSLISFLVRL